MSTAYDRELEELRTDIADAIMEGRIGHSFKLRVYPQIRETKSAGPQWIVRETVGGPKKARRVARLLRASHRFSRTFAIRRKSARRWEVVELDRLSRWGKRKYPRAEDCRRGR